MKNIIFIAPPAAGKGTSAAILKEKYGYAHISTGAILRDVATRNDEMGSYIRETLDNGEFIKNEIVYQLLEERLKEKDCKNGYILDGFPRNIDQAIEYEKILKHLKKDLGLVIVLEIDKEVLLKRITGRRICPNCGAIYNINFEESAPKEEFVCDHCKETLYQRGDDNLEAYETRYRIYLEQTEPLIKYYQDKKVLHKIDASVSKENIIKQIENLLKKEASND